MGTNKTYEERIQAQKEIMEKAAKKIEELKEAAAKKEEEKKQKKIESIMKDIEKALADSPLLSYNKKSDEYKNIINLIKGGVAYTEITEIDKEAIAGLSIYEQLGVAIESQIGRPLTEEDLTGRFNFSVEGSNIYEQIGILAEKELGRPLQEGDQTRFKGFLEFQDRNTPYYRNAMNKGL